mgnify:CR=1 FL=1
MRGAGPGTSSAARTGGTLPSVDAGADRGWVKARQDDASLAKGLNAHEGVLTFKGVSDAFPELAYSSVDEVLAANA